MACTPKEDSFEDNDENPQVALDQTMSKIPKHVTPKPPAGSCPICRARRSELLLEAVTRWRGSAEGAGRGPAIPWWRGAELPLVCNGNRRGASGICPKESVWFNHTNRMGSLMLQDGRRRAARKLPCESAADVQRIPVRQCRCAPRRRTWGPALAGALREHERRKAEVCVVLCRIGLVGRVCLLTRLQHLLSGAMFLVLR